MSLNLQSFTPVSDEKVLKCSINIMYVFFITVTLLLIVGYALSFYRIQTLSLDELQELFRPQWAGYVRPKPEEHFLYISLLLLLPMLIFLAMKIVNFAWLVKIKQSFFSHIAIIITPVLISFPFLFHVDFTYALVGQNDKVYLTLLLLLTMLIIFSQLINHRLKLPFYIVNLFSWIFKAFNSGKVFCILGFMIILFMVVFQSIAFRVVGVENVNDAGAWSVHLQAVYYAVTQVVGGRDLLSNLPAQYGLYAELLKPIFSIIGLSVFKFTVVLTFLHVMGVLAVFFAIFRLFNNKILFFITMVSLTFMSSVTWLLLNAGSWDPLYQISPIRFVFPALSILAFSMVAKNVTVKTVIIFSFVSSIAVLWNLDSGIPVLGAFLFYCFSLFVFNPEKIGRVNSLKFFSIALCVPLLLTSAFILYLQLKSTLPISLIDTLKYQDIFYKTGFGMLPIARGFAPWQIVCGVYVLGIIIAFYTWFQKNRSEKWDMTFYLGILGLGLFSYHEGRSHAYTLIAVSWPVFIISFIMIDHMIRLVKEKKMPSIFLFPCVPILFLGILITSNLFYKIPFLYNLLQKNMQPMLEGASTPVTENVSFIKRNVKEDKKAIILAPLQAVYYGETKLVSPLNGPGHIEMLLRKDWDDMVSQILSVHHKHIFIQLDNELKIPMEYLFVLNKYRILDKNKHMVYLIPKK